MTIKFIKDRNVFQVRYRDSSGKLKRPSFPTKTKAEAFVNRREKEVATKGKEFADINPEERAMLKLALEKSRIYNFNILDACDQYISKAGTKEDILLTDANELFGEWYKGTQKNRISSNTSQLQTTNAFCDSHRDCTVREIGREHILTFLQRPEWTVTTQVGYRRRLNKFFNWAMSEGYRGDNPVTLVKHSKRYGTDLGRVEEKDPDVLLFDDVEKLFRTAHKEMPDFIPYLVLGLFTGIRPTEITEGLGKPGIRWSNINLKKGKVEVVGHASKTRTRRVVTINPNALEWLELGGKLPWKMKQADTARKELRMMAFGEQWREKWGSDIMRHTYATCYLEHFHDANILRKNMGHTDDSRTLEQYYLDRNKIDEEDAASFWSLVPQSC